MGCKGYTLHGHVCMMSTKRANETPLSYPLCKPRVVSSIPGFSSLSDETLNRGPVSVWHFLFMVRKTLTQQQQESKRQHFLFRISKKKHQFIQILDTNSQTGGGGTCRSRWDGLFLRIICFLFSNYNVNKARFLDIRTDAMQTGEKIIRIPLLFDLQQFIVMPAPILSFPVGQICGRLVKIDAFAELSNFLFHFLALVYVEVFLRHVFPGEPTWQGENAGSEWRVDGCTVRTRVTHRSWNRVDEI